MREAPTGEQVAAIQLAMQGETMKIGAGAGSGKTTTLEMCAQAVAPKSGAALVFNAATAKEMQARLTTRGIRNVEARTAHSHAHRGVNVHGRFKGQLDIRTGPWMVRDWCSVPQDGVAGRKSGAVTRAIIATAKAFMYSPDREISPEHVPFDHQRWALDLMADKTAPEPDRIEASIARDAFVDFVVKGAKHYWNLMLTDPKVGITHDFYLKLWHLEGARIGGGGGFGGGPKIQFVLSDESQDLNGVMAAILAEQGVQVIYVGDEHQQIYAWRGSVNMMQKIDAPVTYLTQSFRWGPEVARVANAILALKDPAPPTLRGWEERETVLAPIPFGTRHTVICRTNGCVFSTALDLIDAGRTISVVGSLSGPIKLMQSAYALWSGRGDVVDPEIAIFQAWDELQLAAQDDPTLGLVVDMVESHQHELPKICARIAHAGEVPEARADVVLTTAHKAKGREWDHVRLAPDFRSHLDRLRNGWKPREEEVNVLYVAATRARKTLELNGAAAELLDPETVAIARSDGEVRRSMRAQNGDTR